MIKIKTHKKVLLIHVLYIVVCNFHLLLVTNPCLRTGAPLARSLSLGVLGRYPLVIVEVNYYIKK
jgi:hypothetical protein